MTWYCQLSQCFSSDLNHFFLYSWNNLLKIVVFKLDELVFNILFKCHIQIKLRPLNFDKWDTDGVRRREKSLRCAAAFPEVPDAQSELNRQRHEREQRRKPRTVRRESNIDNPEEKIVPRTDQASFSIRRMVDQDEELQRGMAKYKPQILGRGDSRRIRSDRGADEQIGII